MRNTELKTKRNKEILELFYKYLKIAPTVCDSRVMWAVRRIYESPASRYYIEYLTAQRHVSKMINGKPINIQNKYKLEMICELYNQVMDYSRENPNKNIYEYLRELLDKPAKSFYLSEETIRGIIYHKR